MAVFESPNNHSIANYVKFTEEQYLSISREVGKLSPPINNTSPPDIDKLTHALDQNLSDLQRVTIEFLEKSAVSRQVDEEAYRKKRRSARRKLQKTK